MKRIATVILVAVGLIAACLIALLFPGEFRKIGNQ